jgi:dihydrofolate reductase
MGDIRVHEFITLDGVIEDPSWTMGMGFDPSMGAAIGAIVEGCTAILLGRRTYEMFEPAWSARTADDDPGAPFFNETAKYVVSSTLAEASWSNSSILGRYDPDAIRALKNEIAGAVYASGSATLVRALLSDGLVDALHLFVYPVTLGAGLRLFPDDGERLSLSLSASETYDNGVVHLAYAPKDGSR